MDHHFEADPKSLFNEDIWLEWFKQIADFLTERGQDTSVIKTKIKDYVDIYCSGEKINDNEPEPEQAGSTGCDDDGSRHGSSGRDTGTDSLDVSPAPIAADWPGSQEAN